MPFARLAWLALASASLLACDRSVPRSETVRREAGVATGTSGSPRACNGHRELCDRRFDRVAFPAAHNAHSAREYGYPINANQISGFTKQLEDGIRAMLVDVYEEGDATVVFCHGVCSLAETPHLDGLREIKAFLDTHPDEVLTLIYEDHAAPAEIVRDLETTGLAALAYTHEPGAEWPTLGEMIDHGTRLVVTAENSGGTPAWFHHVWDLAFDTPYTFHAASEFTCALNRGAAANSLYLLNHWLSVSPPLNLPTEDGAKLVNQRDVLEARATACAKEAVHTPNFVAVDFYEDGDLFKVVDTLNGLDRFALAR